MHHGLQIGCSSEDEAKSATQAAAAGPGSADNTANAPVIFKMASESETEEELHGAP